MKISCMISAAVILSNGAMAQTAPSSAMVATVLPCAPAVTSGKWVQASEATHDVRVLEANQQSALMAELYVQAGSHQPRVSSHTLPMVRGKVSVGAETLQALDFLLQD